MLIQLALSPDGQINPNELIRFHPLFNSLSVTATKQLLSISKLTTLLCDTILYN